MCFSATASFVGGAIITSAGIATVLQNKENSQRAFAAIPLVFGIQQIAEGFVWVALRSSDTGMMLQSATTVFLVAALLVWPTLVPLSILLMEKNRKRRRMLALLLGVGIAVTISYGFGMLIFNVTTQISNFHILYTSDAPPPLAGATMIAYLAASLLPMFVSSTRKVFWFGVIVAIAYGIAHYFFREYLVSVWCFFAAVVSMVIYLIIREQVRVADLPQVDPNTVPDPR
jgi:hypothetical protein